MSVPSQIVRDQEGLWADFDEAMNTNDWQFARNIIKETMELEHHDLAKTMNDHYHEYVCKDCQGTGIVDVYETGADDPREKECWCVVEYD